MPQRRVLPLAALAVAWLLSCAMALPARAADLDAVLADAMKETQAPALAVLVLRDGAVEGQAVRGVRRNDQPGDTRIDDVWATGSNAKPMTAALIARLVDRGLLRWDTPLAKMLPDLASTMHPGYRQVTLRQLLSHRAGLPQDTADLAFFASFFQDRRPLPEQRLAYVRRALAEKPEGPVGVDHYSNTGFMVSAVIAERRTGQSFEALMRSEVFEPLGITSASYEPTHDGQPRGHRAGKPAIQAFTTAEEGNPPMFAPAGGELHLTLGDWARFCIDQLAGAQGRGKLLKPASYKLMQTLPAQGHAAVGWGVQASVAGRKGPALLHVGTDDNWYAMVALFPASGRGVLAASNAGADMGGDRAVTAAVGALLPELAPPK